MNKNIYLKFIDSPSKIEENPSGNFLTFLKEIAIKFLFLLIPKANPDFEHLLDNVDYWKIEFNVEENATWRELGFDENGNSIVAMPFRKAS